MTKLLSLNKLLQLILYIPKHIKYLILFYIYHFYRGITYYYTYLIILLAIVLMVFA